MRFYIIANKHTENTPAYSRYWSPNRAELYRFQFLIFSTRSSRIDRQNPPFSSHPSILHFCDFSRVPTGSADYTPGLPSALRRDCTTPLLLGGCGETRGGIWSCIYAAGKVLSARSTSRFSRENPFRIEVRGLDGRALYQKFAKIPRHMTIIFEKFRTRGSLADRFDGISL